MKRFPSDSEIEPHHNLGLEPWGKYTIKQVYEMLDAWAYCDDKDKSTEFMFQYMSDTSGVDYDDVVEYVCSKRIDSDRDKYYKILREK